MKTSTLTGIAIGLLLFGVSCNKPVPKRQANPLQPILGVIDFPTRGATLQGSSATIGGWALAEDGVQRVAIYVDKQFIVFATLGGNRPDIAKAFPHFTGAATSGWSVIMNFSQMLEGEHEMVMQIKTKGGNIHDFPPVPFKVVHENK